MVKIASKKKPASIQLIQQWMSHRFLPMFPLPKIVSYSPMSSGHPLHNSVSSNSCVQSVFCFFQWGGGFTPWLHLQIASFPHKSLSKITCGNNIYFLMVVIYRYLDQSLIALDTNSEVTKNHMVPVIKQLHQQLIQLQEKIQADDSELKANPAISRQVKRMLMVTHHLSVDRWSGC